MTKTILKVSNLKKYFTVKTSLFGKPLVRLKAVDDVSFELSEGETLGIVGESGCGKTTMGRSILRVHDIDAGQIIFDGQDITHLSRSEMRKIRTQLQIIFQDPYSSLPPRMSVGNIIAEAVKVHNIVPKEKVKEHVLATMAKCGLQAHYYNRYPHEFSGGQRQRICIARTLAVNPKLVVCDEPVSALDVSIQAQIINLLQDLKKEFGLSYVFISHDLSVISHISDRICVMYLGSVMELGTRDRIFENTTHPYTQILLSAVPVADPRKTKERIIPVGDIPSPVNPPKGCKFCTRCPHAKGICIDSRPALREIEPGHFVACHFAEELAKGK
ncbi:MAG: dipeptide ABC transporter ATP-binding protein [Firmicutes bacterium]|nr:dipeptide ABC transporter ATP-binding protein [Bacillota bacterium]